MYGACVRVQMSGRVRRDRTFLIPNFFFLTFDDNGGKSSNKILSKKKKKAWRRKKKKKSIPIHFWNLSSCAITQPPTEACKKWEAQSEHVHVAHKFFFFFCTFRTDSACSVGAWKQKFLRRNSVGSLLRASCWLGRQQGRRRDVFCVCVCVCVQSSLFLLLPKSLIQSQHTQKKKSFFLLLLGKEEEEEGKIMFYVPPPPPPSSLSRFS